MPEYIGSDGQRRHVPRRDRKRAMPPHPAVIVGWVLIGLVSAISVVIGLTTLARRFPDAFPFILIGVVVLIFVGGIVVFLRPARHRSTGSKK